MDWITAGLPVWAFGVAMGVTLFAGFVKGAVGFAMPLIMVSVFNSIMPPELAVAALILPTLVTNLRQSTRQGVGPAVAAAWDYRRFLAGTVLFILISAQFLEDIPRTAYLLLLGIPVTAFAVLQLAGVPLALRLEHRRAAEWALGIVGGLYGGVSGIWGPPLLVYLLSVGAEKREIVRVQGVVFLIGAVALLAAHLETGVANMQSLGLSAALCLPAVLGMALGFRVQDRLDQVRFRRWTQGLLVVTGLNLIRQAVM